MSILFKNGKDGLRFPGFDKNGKIVPAKTYREREIVKIFGLDEIRRQTK